MKHAFTKLKRRLRYRDRDINRQLDPGARLCRRSEVVAPFLIGPGCRVRRSRIGPHTYLSRDVAATRATLGPYCSIGPEVIIGGLGKHPASHFSTSPVSFSPDHPVCRVLGTMGHRLDFEEEEEVVIGADVWIGARAMIADGVRIGTGAIIGANTFITRDVPPYAVIYGSPPAVRRFRFAPEIISALLESRWWESRPDQVNVPALLKLTRQAGDA